ncbi:MAG: hypothetical protein KME04_11430 [Pleurocapsa minor GSE-CHR-MK-17-07R]|jgi:hypothetical protein|nr:hypothetical protein [Pleurocapsa minor GSE-CHR-MK 17-07R]
MTRLRFSFRRTAAIAAASLLLASTTIVYAQDLDNPLPATGGTRESVALTIYNQGTALVRDSRSYTLGEGINILNFTDVAAGIDPTSVQFDSATSPDGLSVLEQSYVYDLVDSFALLNRYLDQRIELTTNDGEVFAGELLSGRTGDIILRDDEGQVLVVNISNVRDLRFPELPGGLITRPTLRWLLDSDASGDQSLELTYLTSGMNWSADYVVLVNPDNSGLDLNGWITLNNTSGASFENAIVKLIAGDVNRLPDMEQMLRAEEMMYDAVASAVPAPQVEQREFSEYQLYEIGRPVTVLDNETKQVEFVSGSGVPASTFYVYDGSPLYYGYVQSDQYYGATGITDVQNFLTFTTDEEGGLGADLPSGRIRVYQEDVDGTALLIGENTIEHTPQGEEVEIYLGNAFDLVGERTQTAFRMIGDRTIEETYEIRLRNRKDDQAVQIRVPENLFRWSEWEILESSAPYTQLNSNTIEYRVDVPPQGETVITYTVRYSW